MIRRLTAFVVAVVFAALANTPSDARQHHKRHHYSYAKTYKSFSSEVFDQAAIAPYPTAETHQNRIIANPMGRRHIAPTQGYDVAERVVSHPAGCPRVAFCGCGTSVKVFGHPVRDLYLAANWYRFPSAIAAAGMVAIFGRHHVAYIESVDANGNAVLYDPNSGGHLTRVHVRNISHAHIVNPGSRMASR